MAYKVPYLRASLTCLLIFPLSNLMSATLASFLCLENTGMIPSWILCHSCFQCWNSFRFAHMSAYWDLPRLLYLKLWPAPIPTHPSGTWIFFFAFFLLSSDLSVPITSDIFLLLSLPPLKCKLNKDRNFPFFFFFQLLYFPQCLEEYWINEVGDCYRWILTLGRMRSSKFPSDSDVLWFCFNCGQV